jgi:hypothetical protein
MAGEAKLTAISPHYQKMILAGTVWGVAGLADQSVLLGSETAPSGNDLIGCRPGHSPNRMRTQFRALGMFKMAHLAKLAGVVWYAQENCGGDRFGIRT